MQSRNLTTYVKSFIVVDCRQVGKESAQWYCIEADECGDDLLAAAHCVIDEESHQWHVSPFFAPTAFTHKTLTGTTIPRYLFSQLRNIGMQLSLHRIRVELQDYLEEVVAPLESLSFQEIGGEFSSTLQTMIHHFEYTYPSRGEGQESSDSRVTGAAVSASSLLEGAEVVLVRAGGDEGSSGGEGDAETGAEVVPGEMKSLIETLFVALHKEAL